MSICTYCEKEYTGYGSSKFCSMRCNLFNKLLLNKSGCLEFTGPLDKWGYGKIRFKGKDIKSHRASWIIHNGTIPDGLIIRHDCDNPCCCNIGHLKIGSFKDNSQDMVDRNRQTIGERNPMAKLTEKDVIEIRALSSQGNSNASIARMLSMHPTNVGCIINRKTWTHVE